jgi:hypothetical protein
MRRTIAIVSALVVAACGSTSSNSTATTTLATSVAVASSSISTVPPPTTTVVPKTATTGFSGGISTTTPTASTSPPVTAPLDAPAVEAVKKAFVTFFDGGNPDVDGKVASIQHGEALRSMITDATVDPQFSKLSTEVRTVSSLAPLDCTAAGEISPCALVVHDMFLGGLPAFVGRTSHAVKVGDRWLVSASSWCSIVAIGGQSCPTLPTT